MGVTVLVNGDLTRCVDVSDRGFQYGDGVFTTLPVRHGIPLFFSYHLARLERDCRKLFIPFPERGCLVREGRGLCESQPNGVLKIQITRGQGGRGYRCPEPTRATRVLGIHPLPDYPAKLAEEGVEVRVCRTRLGINPSLAGVKHMNRLEQILARAEWDQVQIQEGLMLDSEDHVTEGTMTNLFLVKDKTLYTPKLDLCGVAGVMRALIMEGVAALGLAIAEQRVGLADVYAADELFLTNSVIGLWPIRRLEQQEYSVGPIAGEVRRWLANKAREESAAACIG